MIQIPSYKQNDPRWAGLTIGTTGRTVGSHGCLLTCLAMQAANFAIGITPAELRNRLAAYDGFMDSGDLMWTRLKFVMPKVHFVYRWDTTNLKEAFHQRLDAKEAVRRVNRLVRLGMPVCVNVDNIGNDGQPDHWVLMVNEFGKYDNMLDPAGNSTSFEERYGDPNVKLYGYAEVVGSPINFPEAGDSAAGIALWKLIELKKGAAPQSYLNEAIDNLLHSF